MRQATRGRNLGRTISRCHGQRLTSPLVEDDLETRLLNILAVTGFPNPHLDWLIDFDSICSNTRDDSEGQIVEILAYGLYGHLKT